MNIEEEAIIRSALSVHLDTSQAIIIQTIIVHNLFFVMFFYGRKCVRVCATLCVWMCDYVRLTEVSCCFNCFGPSNFVVRRRNMSRAKVKNNDIVIVNNSSTVFDLIVLRFSIDCFCSLWDGNMCSRVLMIFFCYSFLDVHKLSI